MVKLKLKNCQLLLDLYTYTYVVYQLMYENVYGKTPPRFGENAVTLPLDVDRPCFEVIFFSHRDNGLCFTKSRLILYKFFIINKN